MLLLFLLREFLEGGVVRPLQPVVFRVPEAVLALDHVDGVGVSRLLRGVGLAVVDDGVVEEDQSARFYLRGVRGSGGETCRERRAM